MIHPSDPDQIHSDLHPDYPSTFILSLKIQQHNPRSSHRYLSVIEHSSDCKQRANVSEKTGSLTLIPPHAHTYGHKQRHTCMHAGRHTHTNERMHKDTHKCTHSDTPQGFLTQIWNPGFSNDQISGLHVNTSDWNLPVIL